MYDFAELFCAALTQASKRMTDLSVTYMYLTGLVINAE